jgi:hypothetical protein
VFNNRLNRVDVLSLIGQTTASGAIARTEAAGDPQVVVIGDQTALLQSQENSTSLLQQLSDTTAQQANLGRDENLLDDAIYSAATDPTSLQMNAGNERIYGDGLTPFGASGAALFGILDGSARQGHSHGGKDRHL